jgi:hypothetical protein
VEGKTAKIWSVNMKRYVFINRVVQEAEEEKPNKK